MTKPPTLGSACEIAQLPLNLPSRKLVDFKVSVNIFQVFHWKCPSACSCMLWWEGLVWAGEIEGVSVCIYKERIYRKWFLSVWALLIFGVWKTNVVFWTRSQCSGLSFGVYLGSVSISLQLSLLYNLGLADLSVELCWENDCAVNRAGVWLWLGRDGGFSWWRPLAGWCYISRVLLYLGVEKFNTWWSKCFVDKDLGSENNDVAKKTTQGSFFYFGNSHLAS